MEEKDIQNIYKYIHLDYVKKYFPDKEKEQWEAHKRWYSFDKLSHISFLYN